MKNKVKEALKKFSAMSLQSIIMTTFTILSIVVTLITGILLYMKFSSLYREKEVTTTEEMVEQARDQLENYLMSMRQISDTAYYNVVKETDFSLSSEDIHDKINLLYESNKNNLSNIAIYNEAGSLLMAEPIATQKEAPDVTSQGWFKDALSKVENIHFSTPHIQNLFDDGTKQYRWVISLSRAVEINYHGQTEKGVLLVDMNYDEISQMMTQLNKNESKYYYLSDKEGEIIFHPKYFQLENNLATENNQKIATYSEGSHNEYFNGKRRKVLLRDISYTGWKLVGVIPETTFLSDRFKVGLFIALYVVMMAMVLLGVNRLISLRITRPLKRLNTSVQAYESGGNPQIYIGGSSEIRHLGKSIQDSYEENDSLMKEVIKEHNERRKNELDVLQSQINPHFLYNTLESITWMIEGKQNDKAVFMVTQLAKLFRISLSKGKTIISVRDEVQHAKSYMNIQKARYKEKITVVFNIEEDVYDYCMVKLVLQPILENSLNYGINDFDEDNEITITGKLHEGKIYLTVADNGMGISEEQLEFILTDSDKAQKLGSGVGLVNVDQRLKIFFGQEYGLHIESQLDEGTKVTIVVPALPFTKENQQIIEQGYHYGGGDVIERKDGTP